MENTKNLNQGLVFTSDEVITRFNITATAFETALAKARKTFIRLRISVSANLKYKYSITEKGIEKKVMLSPLACYFVTVYSKTNLLTEKEILQLFSKKEI